MTTYQFWRPVLFSAAICVATVFSCRYLLQIPMLGDFDQSAILSLEFPHTSLRPDEVVALQMNGLTNQEDLGLGALQCYCFASPANRVVTGPYRRFAQMVRSTPWDRLGGCTSYSLGEAQVVDDEARVLVSTIGEDRKLHVYAFLLTRQKQAPFSDCWMTSGVFVVFTHPDAMPEPEFDSEQQEIGETAMNLNITHPRGSKPRI